MGGQTAVAMGLHLDMHRMNELVNLDRIRRIARVQAAMSWRDLQDILDPLGLGVQTMQSYANFTVGGTVSVNGHGRYVGHGPVGNSVRALQLVLADGSHAGNQHAILALKELPGGTLVYDAVVYPLLHARPVVQWRNHEASLDVAELEPRTRTTSTYVLQEYFIPVRHFAHYARQTAEVIRKHDAQVLNVSIRHADADPVALLPWAKEDVFSFVVYYKQRTDAGELARIGNWTRDMIETALRFEGRYYLPYQLHATRARFDRAYPEAAQLRELKRAIDPAGKFSNELWRKYLWVRPPDIICL